MIIRILQLAIICSLMIGTCAAQKPTSVVLQRDDFLKEALSGKPTPKTAYYDTEVSGSYQISKNDVLHGIADAAKAARIDLRGMLFIGPYGPTTVFYVYTFVGEKGAIRVNQSTVTQSRFRYKSTGTLTPAQFDALFSIFLKSNLLTAGEPAAGVELKNEILLAQWKNGQGSSYYGSALTPKPGADVNQFNSHLSRLLKSLTKTFPILSHPATKQRPANK